MALIIAEGGVALWECIYVLGVSKRVYWRAAWEMKSERRLISNRVRYIHLRPNTTY